MTSSRQNQGHFASAEKKLQRYFSKLCLFDQKQFINDAINHCLHDHSDISSAIIYGSAVSKQIRKDSDIDVFLISLDGQFQNFAYNINGRWFCLYKAPLRIIFEDLENYSYGMFLAQRFINPFYAYLNSALAYNVALKIRSTLLRDSLIYYSHINRYYKYLEACSEHWLFYNYLDFLIFYDPYYLYPLKLVMSHPTLASLFREEFRTVLQNFEIGKVLTKKGRKYYLRWDLISSGEGRFNWQCKIYRGRLKFWNIYANTRGSSSLEDSLRRKEKKLFEGESMFLLISNLLRTYEKRIFSRKH